MAPIRARRMGSICRGFAGGSQRSLPGVVATGRAWRSQALSGSGKLLGNLRLLRLCQGFLLRNCAAVPIDSVASSGICLRRADIRPRYR
jgi:hypothetical protein